MEIEGNALLVAGDDTLDTNKFKMFMKLPAGTKTNGETGWCDLRNQRFHLEHSLTVAHQPLVDLLGVPLGRFLSRCIGHNVGLSRLMSRKQLSFHST
jgi:hypothetical protein